MAELLTDAEKQQLLSNLESTLVSYFRTTSVGQELEQEYIKQGVIQKVDNPLLWLIVGVIVLIVVYPYFRK